MDKEKFDNCIKKYNYKELILMIACMRQDVEAVQLLLEHDADVNFKNDAGHTPLIYASDNGYADIVKILIENGADIEQKDSDGDTALMLAAANGHTDVVKLLKLNSS